MENYQKLKEDHELLREKGEQDKEHYKAVESENEAIRI